MDEEQAKKQLENEGFKNVCVHSDGPNAHYPDHAHPVLTTHVILEGEMTLTQQGNTVTYKKGDRVDVPASTVHSARIGPEGCTYLVGEKQ